MSKIIVLFLTFTFTTVMVIAQNKLSPKEILDNTAERMQAKGGIRASFTTTTFIGTTPHETINGTLDMLGNKYVMTTPSMQTWFNGKDQWTLVPENKEVNLVTPTDEELQVSSPTAFLTLYKHGFHLSSNKGMLRGHKIWDITLRPKKSGQEPSRIVISIDQETFTPMCLRIRNEGNWTRISITDLNFNANLSDAQFQFQPQKYPDYEIIDMR
ncbi:MAG: outer-membrane lipoprotein carrier protein LolA [Bacteroides sp.]|nr:outer-membrane lipoprotein carrier protein LolA [Bacteroides sp.]MCM1446869.1 outer-membrane lipoprotein carrier protein LolA [Bacteroides sp.]MCM1515311.1 outer-membrane lipoprotein carrier protein LolA [Paraprevotella sp.]